MARPGITYDEVAAAASQIAASGENPTVERVRAVTKTGSQGTILRHLRQWRESQPVQRQGEHTLSDQLQAAIAGEIDRARHAAVAEFEKKISALESDLASAEAQIDGDAARISELEEALERTSAKLEQATALLNERSTEIERLTVQLDEQRGIAESTRTELAKSEIAREQAEANAGRVADLERRIIDLERENAVLQTVKETLDALKLKNNNGTT